MQNSQRGAAGMSNQSTETDYIIKGAIWRRKKTGALVRITAAKNHASSWDPTPYYDISWETVEKPIRRGVSYQDYWLKNCEPVEVVYPPAKGADDA